MSGKSDYELYVEKYCKTYHITPEEAKEHAYVKEYKRYLEEEENNDE